MFDRLLFDLDGTLTDSSSGIYNAVVYALKSMNRDIPGQATLKKFIGPPLLYSFSEYCGMSGDESEEAVRLYRVYYKEKGLFENKVYPGIPELLQELKSEGKTLIVATSKPEEFSKRILNHFELDKYFDRIVGASMDTSRNTKDAVIQAAIMDLEEGQKKKTVMIGDRHHDIDGAKANGIRSIGVLYGFGSLEEFNEAGADFIAENVSEIEKIVNR